MELKQQK